MDMTTTVVCLKRTKGRIVQDCDVYIGRSCMRGGWALAASKWANPFSVYACNGRAEEAVRRYRDWIARQPHLLADLEELRGKRLGCWCKKRGDEPCHGDVLVELLLLAQSTSGNKRSRDAATAAVTINDVQ